jgi:prepilin-type N-terminal cleavage/methylation domain-containing protein/prepilin-type processing-associated H-X9-DG protein
MIYSVRLPVARRATSFGSVKRKNQSDDGPLQRSRAFTLVELLVVMAILGVLMSLLLPNLRGAMDAAKRVKCKSNLRQIGLAMVQYAGDHEGRMLPARHAEITWDVNETWYRYATPYLDPAKSADRYAPAGAKEYYAAWRHLACPAQTPANEPAPLWPTWSNIGLYVTYGIHISSSGSGYTYSDGYGLIDNVTGRRRNLAGLVDPSRTLVFTDTWTVDYVYNLFYINTGGSAGSYLPNRHAGYNASFADGHVESLSEDTIANPDARIWRAL